MTKSQISENGFRLLCKALVSQGADVNYRTEILPTDTPEVGAILFEEISLPSGEIVARLVHERPRRLDMNQLTGCLLLHGDTTPGPAQY